MTYLKRIVEKEHYNRGFEISGVAGSPGISIGKAYVIRKKEVAPTGIRLESENDILTEIANFEKAVNTSVIEVQTYINTRNSGSEAEEIEILETHIEFLTDPQIRLDVLEKIKEDKKNAIDAVLEVIQNAVQTFKDMNDEYMSARAADVQDIGDRILRNLNHLPDERYQKLESDTIIIADDISPTDTISLDTGVVAGFATRLGGKTSHTAILAKSKNIPAVLGCGPALNSIDNDDLIIVDGTIGVLIVNPDEDTLATYRLKMESQHQQDKFLRSLKDVSAQTSDGVKVTLLANIAHADDMEGSLEYGAQGAGLFRTELLFMNRDSFPSEDEQFEYYRKVATKSHGKPVIVRTIDIGGDKPLEYFMLPKEENPFLGYRAIRICLDRRDLFVTQLKAILRASMFGNFKIMFPMISNVNELRIAKTILGETKVELEAAGQAFDKHIQTGIMIEVPSAAITADILAKEVDFFSIGTNDLCQYTLAVDRGNEKVKDLYDPYHPAVLRLIRSVIDQAHSHEIEVGMCGELASDPMATLLLVGMGLREFSMTASSIPAVKNVVINSSYVTANKICETVMSMDDSKSIRDYLQLQK